MARKQPEYPTKRSSRTRPRLASGIVGGILLGLAGIWLGWIFLHRVGLPSVLPIVGAAPTAQSIMQFPPLAAEGITLGYANQAAALNKQQALLIAGQLEAQAAAHAKSVMAQYVLLNYAHAKLNGVPAWMVVYQRIPLEPADVSVDPTPFPRSYYDLYIFLDANSGKELLAILV